MSDQPVEVALDPGLIGPIGLLVRQPKAQISPFAGNGGGLSPPQLMRLRELGVIDSGGSLASRLERPLRILAASRAALHVLLDGTSGVVDAYVYFAPDGGAPVALVGKVDAVVIREPVSGREIIDLVREAMGGSVLPGLDFKVELRALPATVLAVMQDTHRARLLYALAEARTVPAEVLTPDAIRARLLDAERDGWLTRAVRSVSPTLSDTSPEAVEDALRELATAGHVTEQQSGGYGLHGTAELLVRGMLVKDNELRVVAITESETGTMQRTAFVCLQSGVHDVLLLQCVGDVVRAELTTPAAVIEFIEMLLQQGALWAMNPR